MGDSSLKRRLIRTLLQLLLPFSLEPYSSNGYANRSLIAMFVVGGLCLIAYAIYEPKWAPFPSAPKRVLGGFGKTLYLVLF